MLRQIDAVDGRTGLFSSSLVPQQTKRQQGEQDPARANRQPRLPVAFERHARSEAYRLPPADATETNFRHSGWKVGRQRVMDALRCIGGGGARLERFQACGSDAVAEWSPSRRKHRIRANYCGDRLCEPCQRARANNAIRKFLRMTEGQAVRFGTLTLQASKAGLSETIRHLYDSFTRLRHSKTWKDAVRGGVAVCEITRGKHGTHWHVHLHYLCVGTWIEQRELSRAWARATGGSFVVDIRFCRENRKGVEYVAKYCTKGFDRSCTVDRDALLEVATALRGRRMFATFGSWHGVDPEEEEQGEKDWKKVGRLTRIIEAAGRGEQWAVGVLRSLRCVHLLAGGESSRGAGDDARQFRTGPRRSRGNASMEGGGT